MALSCQKSGMTSPIRNSKMPISKSGTTSFKFKNLKSQKAKGHTPHGSPKPKDHSKKNLSSKTNSKFSSNKPKNPPKTSPNPSWTTEPKSSYKTSPKNSTINSKCTKKNGPKTKENAFSSCKPNEKNDSTSQNYKKNSKNLGLIEAKYRKSAGTPLKCILRNRKKKTQTKKSKTALHKLTRQ